MYRSVSSPGGPIHLTSRFGVLMALASVVTMATPAQAQEPPSRPFIMRAVETTVPPIIDGTIEDWEWTAAARGEDFIQYEPNRGDPAELPTTVLLLYDDLNLYVAFEAYDPEESMAPMTQRDAPLWADDSVQIYIDSFHDRRSGYMFMTNVLGTQLDGRIAEDGTSNDINWDAVWASAGRRTDYGYSAEFSIPFSSVQYAVGTDTTWGINFGRTRVRSLERTYWAGPVDHWGRMSQAGDLVGLDVPEPTRR